MVMLDLNANAESINKRGTSYASVLGNIQSAMKEVADLDIPEKNKNMASMWIEEGVTWLENGFLKSQIQDAQENGESSSE